MPSIKLALMGKHFLYLPLFHAKQMGFFGLLPAGFSIEFDVLTQHTDVAVYEAVMGGRFQLGVCDPTVIFGRTPAAGQRQPSFLCALVRNGAFWAVDRCPKQPVSYGEIAERYDNIIAYQPGTTSHGIAMRLKNLAPLDKPLNIIEVDPLQELPALKASELNTIAISPDILQINLLRTDPNYHIYYSFSSSPDYDNMLTSAVLARDDFVRANQEFVQGLVSALQRAILCVRRQDSEVIKSGVEVFSTEIPNANPVYIENSIQDACRDDIFPVDIGISLPSWRKASEAHFQSIAGRATSNDIEIIDHYYARFVSPYRDLSSKALDLAMLESGVPMVPSIPVPSKSKIKILLNIFKKPVAWLSSMTIMTVAYIVQNFKDPIGKLLTEVAKNFWASH